MGNKTKIISIFAVMIVVASAFGVLVMAANSIGEDTTTIEKTIDECNFYATSYWPMDEAMLIKGTVYANGSNGSRGVFVNAQFENLRSSPFTYPQRNCIEFITLTPGWKIMDVNVQCEEPINMSIVLDSPVNGSDMLTVFYFPTALFAPELVSGYLQIEIIPTSTDNPPDKCCIQARVTNSYEHGEAYIRIVDSCTTTVNF